jgi:hypothetical protein
MSGTLSACATRPAQRLVLLLIQPQPETTAADLEAVIKRQLVLEQPRLSLSAEVKWSFKGREVLQSASKERDAPSVLVELEIQQHAMHVASIANERRR